MRSSTEVNGYDMGGRGGRSSRVSRETFHAKVEPNLRGAQAEFLEVVLAHPAGITAKEVAAKLGKEFNAVSGRKKELQALGLIRGTGERRDGSEVLKAIVADSKGQVSLFEGAA